MSQAAAARRVGCAQYVSHHHGHGHGDHVSKVYHTGFHGVGDNSGAADNDLVLSERHGGVVAWLDPLVAVSHYYQRMVLIIVVVVVRLNCLKSVRYFLGSGVGITNGGG